MEKYTFKYSPGAPELGNVEERSTLIYIFMCLCIKEIFLEVKDKVLLCLAQSPSH